MGQNQIMLLGDKESFIIRVLTKKLCDASLDVINTPMDVEEIDKHWGDTALVTFYMEKDERLPEDIKTFLIDRLEDDNKRIEQLSSQFFNSEYTSSILDSSTRHTTK